jgi:GT2 family glycosyltransferase
VTTLAAVIVNYRRPDLLEACLASLEEALEHAGGGELVVVDNASGDRSVELVRERFPTARLVELAVNRGFGAGVNAGLRQTDAEWVFLLNNDATVAPGALSELLRVGRGDARVGSVAAQMLFAARPEVINSAGLEVDRLGVVSDRLVGMPASASEQEPVEVFGASGGASLYRRAALDDIGGFDEGFFMFGEDADVAWRLRMRGWRSLYAPGAVVFHHHSASCGGAPAGRARSGARGAGGAGPAPGVARGRVQASTCGRGA